MDRNETESNSKQSHSSIFDDVPRIDLLKDPKPDVPLTCGIYCFRNREDGSPAYIGSATGQRGLRARISQHLNPIYLEARPRVFSRFDEAQVAKGIKHNGKLVIEKSYFRKQLARRHDLAPGTECLSYLISRFTLSYVEFPDASREEILLAESELIEDQNPTYN